LSLIHQPFSILGHETFTKISSNNFLSMSVNLLRLFFDFRPMSVFQVLVQRSDGRADNLADVAGGEGGARVVSGEVGGEE
jgi:hypothetical protein